MYKGTVIPKVVRDNSLWDMQLGNIQRRFKSVTYECPNDGTELRESDMFCPRCGALILWQI